jgi:hypothetical protein
MPRWPVHEVGGTMERRRAAGIGDDHPLLVVRGGIVIRRLLLFTVAALTLAALGAGPAWAGTTKRPAPAHAGPQLTVLPRPVAALLATGTAGIDGHVYDRFGNGMSGAMVTWRVLTGTGSTTTGMAGDYTFANADATSGAGALDVVGTDPVDGSPILYRRTGATWADLGQTTVDFPAAGVSVSVERDPIAGSGWTSVSLVCVGSDATSPTWSSADVPATDSTSSPVTGDATVMAGSTFTGAAVYFAADEGVEVTPPATKTSGASPSPSPEVTADESTAQRITVTAPNWASGKPGTTATVAFDRFPAGWIVDLDGFDDHGPATSGDYMITTPFPPVGFKVPSTAKPGYIWWFRARHRDGSLSLRTPFQVCTFKSSRYTLKKGRYVILSGVVPVAGHVGSKAGSPTTVTIWAHNGKAGVPDTWNAASKGWYKLKIVKTNGLGAFHTGKLWPPRTSTVVARYPGDEQYRPAYTSKFTITVNK